MGLLTLSLLFLAGARTYSGYLYITFYPCFSSQQGKLGLFFSPAQNKIPLFLGILAKLMAQRGQKGSSMTKEQLANRDLLAEAEELEGQFLDEELTWQLEREKLQDEADEDLWRRYLAEKSEWEACIDMEE